MDVLLAETAGIDSALGGGDDLAAALEQLGGLRDLVSEMWGAGQDGRELNSDVVHEHDRDQMRQNLRGAFGAFGAMFQGIQQTVENMNTPETRERMQDFQEHMNRVD